MAAVPEQKGLDIDPWQTHPLRLLGFVGRNLQVWTRLTDCDVLAESQTHHSFALSFFCLLFPTIFFAQAADESLSRYNLIPWEAGGNSVNQTRLFFLSFQTRHSLAACRFWTAPGCTGWKVKPDHWYIVYELLESAGKKGFIQKWGVECYLRYSSEAKVCTQLVWKGALAFRGVWASGAVEVRDMLVQSRYRWAGAEGSAANCSSASLPVLQSGHRLLIAEVATNEPVCHAHIHTQMHTQSWRLITSNERKSAHLLGWNSFGVPLKFKGSLNITTILRRWAFSRWWGLTECKFAKEEPDFGGDPQELNPARLQLWPIRTNGDISAKQNSS